MSALDDAVADAVFLAFEMEGRFADLYGGFAWDANFVDGSLTFFTEPETVLTAHFLGSAAPGPGTWMWGWHNVNGFPESSVAAAERVRSAFSGSNVAELEQATIALTPQLPLLLTLASKAATGIFASVDVPAAGGTRVYLLLEHESLHLAPPDAATVARVIGDGLGVTEIANHRRAVESYARLRGIELAPTAEGVELHLADGALAVGFDELNRVASIRGTITPSQAAAQASLVAQARQDQAAPATAPTPAEAAPAVLPAEAQPAKRWWQRSRS